MYTNFTNPGLTRALVPLRVIRAIRGLLFLFSSCLCDVLFAVVFNRQSSIVNLHQRRGHSSEFSEQHRTRRIAVDAVSFCRDPRSADLGGAAACELT
jgi:hypothetical protein